MRGAGGGLRGSAAIGRPDRCQRLETLDRVAVAVPRVVGHDLDVSSRAPRNSLTIWLTIIPSPRLRAE